jgi:phosphohistidine phosphatase
MKILTLIRHAAANNKQISQADSERSLSTMGRFDGENIAQQLKRRNCLPDYLLCSPAKRTVQTATILCQTLQLNPKLIKIDNAIYSGDLEAILNSLYGLTTGQQLFVIGHNPTLSDLAHRLCDASKTIILPPAGVISLKFAIKSWDALLKISGKLLFFIKPNHEPC